MKSIAHNIRAITENAARLGLPGQRKLLDLIKELHALKSDAALSRFLNIAPPMISKMRYGIASVNATSILKIHKCTGMAVADIESLIAA